MRSAVKKIVSNAFDFFNKSIDELEKEPKFSLINFATAIELFLKARLAYEHWTLIYDKPELSDIDRFKAGDFSSIKPAEIEKRITNVTGEQFSRKESQCYKEIRLHRNKIVHFFNKNIEDDSEKELIVLQELCAWNFIHNRLKNEWFSILNIDARDIHLIDYKMKRISKYLKFKFDELKPTIEAKKQDGATFKVCATCGYEASQNIETLEDREMGTISYYKCVICKDTQVSTNLSCTKCWKLIEDLREHQECPHCGESTGTKDIIDSLSLIDYDTFESGTLYCQECEHYQKSVILFGGIYVCLNCYEQFTDEDIKNCDFCNEQIAGGGEDSGSYAHGCSMCDGAIAWDRD